MGVARAAPCFSGYSRDASAAHSWQVALVFVVLICDEVVAAFGGILNLTLT